MDNDKKNEFAYGERMKIDGKVGEVKREIIKLDKEMDS